jgi:histone H3/H4
MWSGQDARTASIDIEARAVEEPSPVVIDAGTAREEVEFVQPSPAQAAPESTTQAEKPLSGSLELSPSVIDEIVRRVVAQMSESVVKEIAWEVVPDCVERVIENLTRESLSKNH